MNLPHTPDRQTGHSIPAILGFHRKTESVGNEDAGVLAKLSDLWEARVSILVTVTGFLLLGGLYLLVAPPVFQSEAMVKVQDKRDRPTDPTFTKIENMFGDSSEPEAEAEIFKGTTVLGRAITALKLDISAKPILFPVLGRALARRNPQGPRLAVGTFRVPDDLRGDHFRITALADGRFRWDDPAGTPISFGGPGEILTGAFRGMPLELKVDKITGRPGQRFDLVLRPMTDAIADLRFDLDVVEAKKPTNILNLTCRAPSSAAAAQVLRQVMDEYLGFKQESRRAGAVNAMGVLQGKLVDFKSKLAEAEDRLHEFRSRYGAVDLSREATLALEQRAIFEDQISALKQRKQDLLRTYSQNSDIVATVDQQIGKLEQKAAQLDSKVRVLPTAQQESARLTREVQIQTEQYTALINNIQQLQVASAGEVATSSVVDWPSQPKTPIAPVKGIIMMLSFALGLAAGVALTALRRAFKGIEDHRVFESKLGLPVLVTIPHSKDQEGHQEALLKGTQEHCLLAVSHPVDLAIESLRSLRTTLNFSIKMASNPVVVISGPSPAIGKSFVSVNFASVLAQSSARVLLVDGDLRKGNLHRYFGIKKRFKGLSEILSGQLAWQTAIRSTPVDGLDLIISGVLPPNPSELLLSPRFPVFIEEVSKHYDYVIIDAPPVLPVTDATILSAQAGTVFLVTKFGRHSIDEVQTMQDRLVSHGVRINGLIFNDIQPSALRNNYRYGNYVYHYGFEK
jgi:tyrosine-protein kinase Etk/Wzc